MRYDATLKVMQGVTFFSMKCSALGQIVQGVFSRIYYATK